MLTHQLDALKRILEDYLFILHKRLDMLVWKHDGESEPYKTDFSFTTITQNQLVHQFKEKDSCTLCHRRISYKINQFEEKVKISIPLLILVHNTFLSQKGKIYHEPEVENEFKSILKESLEEMNPNLLVREVLRCHFGSEEVQNEEWIKHCQAHIQSDLEKYTIKGIWVVGEAAPLLFKDKEDLTKRMGKTTYFMGLPTIVSYGPSRLVFMKKNKYPQDKISNIRSIIIQKIQNFKKENLSSL